MRSFFYIVLFACIVSCKESGKGDIDPRVLTLPAFSIQSLDSTHTINTRDIAAGQPTIVMYFSPDCKFSRQQTERIIAGYPALQHIRFYMCSSDPLNKLNTFSKHYQLNRYNNITVGRDYNLFFQEQLKVPAYPWLFIYAPDKKLKRIVTGSVEVKTILDMLNS
jgi:hypothetical protein